MIIVVLAAGVLAGLIISKNTAADQPTATTPLPSVSVTPPPPVESPEPSPGPTPDPWMEEDIESIARVLSEYLFF